MGVMRKNMGSIWGKVDCLGIFGVKTHKIIGQKSQNLARYYSRIFRKSLTPLPPPTKSQYDPQIATTISSIFLFFLPDNPKNT